MNSQKRMELVIDGAPARRLGSALAEVWVFRGTIRAFAERDIRVKYKQTALGVAWAVIQPLGFMAIFTLTIGMTLTYDPSRLSFDEVAEFAAGWSPPSDPRSRCS